MKIIFIAYADEKMAYSLKRIGRQARRLGIFDEVLLYTPDDLPSELKSSPLMQHSYGGGYWAWKPWIILHTLEMYEEGSIVCYVDAGCTLHNAPEWKDYVSMMENFDTLLYEYPDEMPLWIKYGTTSTRVKHWTKKSAVLFYDDLVGNDEWREHNKILGGFIWAKGRNNPIITKWMDMVLNHPSVLDDSGVFDEQFPFFVRHKHDQPLLTALSCMYSDKCIVLPEMLDGGAANAAVVATRIRVASWGEFVVDRLKAMARSMLGNRVEPFKRIIRYK